MSVWAIGAPLLFAQRALPRLLLGVVLEGLAQLTARKLAESDLLAGKLSMEAFEVEGGDLRPEALVGALGS